MHEQPGASRIQEPTIDPFRILWKRKALILAGGIICALVTLVVCFFLPKSFEAQATIIILPSRVPPELRLPQLSAEAFHSLLDSDAVKTQVQTTLRHKGLLPPGELIAQALRSEIVPPREKDPTLRPILRLIAQAQTAEKAARLANTWADIFLVEGGKLVSHEKEKALKLLQKNYLVSEKKMGAMIAERSAKSEAHERLVLRKRRDWEGKMLSQKQAFEKLQRSNAVESERQRLAFEQRWRLEALQEEISRKESILTRTESEGDDAKTSPALRKEVDELRRFLYEKNAELYELQKTRESDSILGMNEQDTKLTEMKQQRDSEIESVVRKYNQEMEPLKRRLDRQELEFAQHTNRQESINLLQPEDLSDLKIGVSARAPQKPIRPRMAFNTAVALGLGLAVSVMLVFINESFHR